MQVKKQEEVKPVERFTGLAPFRVVSLNPSLEELKAIGVTYLQNEPEYSNDKGLRLDFWLQNLEGVEYKHEGEVKNSGPLTRKLSYFIEDTDKVASTGKVKIVNDLLQNTWADSIEALLENDKMSWFSKNHNLRVAKTGEVEVLEYFQRLMGLSTGFKDKQGDEVKFATSWSKIVAGDTKELKKYVKDAYDMGNGLTVLLGVKTNDEGKQFDDVYTKHIQSSKNKTTKAFEKSLLEYDWKSDYQNSLTFQLYTGTSIPSPSKLEEVTEDSGLPF
jgi:hypothetical protein